MRTLTPERTPLDDGPDGLLNCLHRDYDFYLIHQDGSKHTNADALNRVPVATVNTVHDDGIDKLRIQQIEDPKPPVGTVKNQSDDLRKLYDQYDRCSLRDSVVYCRWKP